MRGNTLELQGQRYNFKFHDLDRRPGLVVVVVEPSKVREYEALLAGCSENIIYALVVVWSDNLHAAWIYETGKLFTEALPGVKR